MLAKWWKRIALFICIVAILFNVTYKLVSRIDLKSELKSVMGGEAISFSAEDDNVEKDNK